MDAVLCANALGPSPKLDTPLDFPLTLSSVSQVATTLCPWTPDKCQYRVTAVIRYTPTTNSSSPPTNTADTVAAAAAAQGFSATYVADAQRDPRGYLPLGGRPEAPPATRQLRLELGFAVGGWVYVELICSSMLYSM